MRGAVIDSACEWIGVERAFYTLVLLLGLTYRNLAVNPL